MELRTVLVVFVYRRVLGFGVERMRVRCQL